MTLRSAFVVGVDRAGLLLIAFAAMAASIAASAFGALAADLTVALPDGPLAHVLQEGFVTPFASASGLAVAVMLTDGGIEAGRAAHADLLALSADALASGCKDGTLAKLDWAALGGRDRQVAGTASDCGVGAVLRSVVLAWNRDKFAATPSWGEFWDVAKVPGKRGLRRGARGNLEVALMADGVAAADIYATLRSDAGVERAFRKLDQLKPYLVWWQADDEAAKLLESGEALMTSAPAESIVAAQRGEGGTGAHPGFAVQWSGSLASVESWAAPAAPTAAPTAAPAGPPASVPGAAAAGRFLVFAAEPRNQRRLPALGGFGGAAQGANDGLAPELLAASPSAPANLAAALMLDDGFWRDNGAKLDKLFETWIVK